MRPLRLLLAAAPVVWLFGACADASDVGFFETDSGVPGPTADAGGVTAADSAPGATPSVSPLCRRPVEECALEERSCRPLPTILADGGVDAGGSSSDAASPGDAAPRDASAQDSGADGSADRPLRCSVDGEATRCEVAGVGEDGATCRGDGDCAGGFACVVGAAKTGQCRRYCCSGVCASDASGKRFFCDVQASAPRSAPAPVCMPVRPCALLQTGACEAGETCAPVVQGAASCVAVGPAEEGASCDDTHCKEGLVCLGAPGARKCKRLCHDTLRPCAAGTQCVGGYPYFDQEGFGVCTSGPVQSAR